MRTNPQERTRYVCHSRDPSCAQHPTHRFLLLPDSNRSAQCAERNGKAS
nr:MAG TPA: hypothetical protein [Caudoviricetes sp.]